jgi:hypothetical protein
MLRSPRQYAYVVFGFVQSALTCAAAAAIASLLFVRSGAFVSHSNQSWLVAWGPSVHELSRSDRLLS